MECATCPKSRRGRISKPAKTPASRVGIFPGESVDSRRAHVDVRRNYLAESLSFRAGDGFRPHRGDASLRLAAAIPSARVRSTRTLGVIFARMAM